MGYQSLVHISLYYTTTRSILELMDKCNKSFGSCQRRRIITLHCLYGYITLRISHNGYSQIY